LPIYLENCKLELLTHEIDTINQKYNKVKMNTFENAFEKYMIIVCIIGQLTYYMQAYKIFRYKITKGVSLLGFCSGLISNASWAVYGFLIHNRILMYSSAAAAIGAILVLIGLAIHKEKNARSN
jgi:uncharacterized protein with PQ loop repeat